MFPSKIKIKHVEIFNYSHIINLPFGYARRREFKNGYIRKNHIPTLHTTADTPNIGKYKNLIPDTHRHSC